MYNQNNSNRFNSNKNYSAPRGFNRGGGRGMRTIKSFNPERLMSSQKPVEEIQEINITNTFKDFQFHESLSKSIENKGYIKPTPIQDQAIPHILNGKDLIGIANTGTGKTAAFLLPLINKVLNNRKERILIVAPTRELAFQIKEELITFTRNLGIFSVLCIGGVDIFRQQRDLGRFCNFVIGTPGRLCDLVDNGYLKLSEFRTVVLDEADHMLDIGFIQDVKYLVGKLNPDRQSLFFSATIDNKVKEVLYIFVKNPITISVRTRETGTNIKQEIIKIFNPKDKINILHDLLIKSDFEKVLIFGRTKHGVQHLSDELVRRGFKADAIHGNKKQNQRLRTLDKFKKNQINILLATDVAARGLDIPNVSHVINYELPESEESYIHRIGRTGRADKKGVAITFK